MKVFRRVNKMRIQKTGMTVIPGRLNIVVESRYNSRRGSPGARLRSGSTVVKVVIDNDGRLLFVNLRFPRVF